MSINSIEKNEHDKVAFNPQIITGTAGIEITEESSRWRARDVTYVAGKWKFLARLIPRFSTEDFKAHPDDPSNPYMRTVVRQPVTATERPIPVGVVSNSYCLAQHADVVEKCFEGLRAQKLDPETLKCEVGLSPLGEWMNFRAYFPNHLSHNPQDGNPLALRLECFNSVDGSSRLVILLGWLRFVCSNGLVIGETKAELRDIHDSRLDLEAIPDIIGRGMAKVKSDVSRLSGWEDTTLDPINFRIWIDDKLASAWGKKAACRILHICEDGTDVEITDPFVPGKPSKKATKPIMEVPGSPRPSRNLYDVSQALSWVATRRANAEERIEWQGQIPGLVETIPTKSNTMQTTGA